MSTQTCQRTRRDLSGPSSAPGKPSGRRNLQLVLDSNEYLFALGEALLSTILEDPATYRIKLSRTIL